MDTIILRLCSVVYSLLVLTIVTAEERPFWNILSWGSNAQAWCRFRCDEKLPAGNIFRVNIVGPTINFTTFGNLKLLAKEGDTYIVENYYDMWPWGKDLFCQFQFGVVYQGSDLMGSCSYFNKTDLYPAVPETRPIVPETLPVIPSSISGIPNTLPIIPETKVSSAIDLATWDNTLPTSTGNWRYQGRCTFACMGTYEPGSLIVQVDVDKDTTNFNGFGAFVSDTPVTSFSRSWTLMNRKRVVSNYGLCNFDFELDHQNELPIPKGTCYTVKNTNQI